MFVCTKSDSDRDQQPRAISRPSWPKHNFIVPAGCNRIQLDDRLSRGAAGEVSGVISFSKNRSHPAAAPAADLKITVVVSYARDAEPSQRLYISTSRHRRHIFILSLTDDCTSRMRGSPERPVAFLTSSIFQPVQLMRPELNRIKNRMRGRCIEPVSCLLPRRERVAGGFAAGESSRRQSRRCRHSRSCRRRCTDA